MEEISDEEAEWSDDFEPITFSASNMDDDLKLFDKAATNPVVKFDLNNLPPFTELQHFRPQPAARIFDICSVKKQQKGNNRTSSSNLMDFNHRTAIKPRRNDDGEGGDAMIEGVGEGEGGGGLEEGETCVREANQEEMVVKSQEVKETIRQAVLHPRMFLFVPLKSSILYCLN